MYRYKIVDNDEFKLAYKKYVRKNILKGSLIIIGAINLLILVLLFLALIVLYKSKMIVFIVISSSVLILEAVIFYYAYKKEIKKVLNNKLDDNDELNISFEEEGISLYSNGISRHIKWNALREATLEDNNLIFLYKVNGILGNFFYLKFFNVEKDELIKDIKNYIKVKGY